MAENVKKKSIFGPNESVWKCHAIIKVTCWGAGSPEMTTQDILEFASLMDCITGSTFLTHLLLKDSFGHYQSESVVPFISAFVWQF